MLAKTEFSRYGVSVTVDGEESEIVEHETVVETAVEAAELPRMNVLEKSNGSVAFRLQTGEVNTMCEVSLSWREAPRQT